ncbi:MAG TPA: amylo-alpha-1,6-glucosidase [Pyrinomonadaceae bacterium]|nr:amylo-alpha-1,6-glucosidase [Pyrinomonadaceae bacterium]
MIRFGRETCANLSLALAREWLETNGLGGYASSTITNTNTRRYHGLLVAATRPPLGRIVLLSKLEETLVVGSRRFDLSANQYPNVVHPRGHELQTGFRLDPFPIFTYSVAGIEIEKSVCMIHGENTTVVRYELKEANDAAADVADASHARGSCRLEVRPLVACRDYHSLAHENERLNPQLQTGENLLTFEPYADLPALRLAHDADDFEPAGYWYRNLEYPAERERGFDFREDLFCPVVFTSDMRARTRLHLVASTTRRTLSGVDEIIRAEIARRAPVARGGVSGNKLISETEANNVSETEANSIRDNELVSGDELLASLVSGNELVAALVPASDAYIVARGEQQTVIAGYHWFGDWGRDTMIALPGLALVTGRFETARRILSEFARHASEGMLPNRFPDAGETPDYNTADATLWFFEAVRSLLHYAGDYDFVRAHLYEVLTGIVAWHVRGTRYGIRLDADGLLAAGAGGVQLTWMDAKVGDWVVTPRAGKAVEIQALWYNALRVLAELAGRFDDAERAREYASMAERARASFNEQFWNEAEGCLYDVIAGEMRDASIRPNQILAVSLAHSLLAGERARKVVATVERELLTPYGLRSLSPRDPRYRGRYEGDALGRDGAYHQGTVWAWLLGPFITAYIKTHEAKDEARARARGWLANFLTHLHEAGLGHVSEIFDGDAPHAPRGCIAQAWSVAELLRASIEDVYRSQPE